MATWNGLLQRARKEARLNQRAFAELAGVSEWTVSSYETGRRKPTRETLRKFIRALRLSRERGNEILTSAGFSPLPTNPRIVETEERRAPLAYLQREIAAYAWPCLIINDRFEIAAGTRSSSMSPNWISPRRCRFRMSAT